MKKTSFLLFFVLIFFLEEMEKGNRRRRQIDFHSFFFFLREGKMGGFGSFFVLVSLFRICRGIDKRKNRIYNKIETS